MTGFVMKYTPEQQLQGTFLFSIIFPKKKLTAQY